MANTYTVKKGDTLWDIAESQLGDGNKYKVIAAINKIADPDLIYVGQELMLNYTAGSTTSTNTNSSQVTIKHFGLQSDTDRTVFITWEWSKSNTDHYEVAWWYATKDGVGLIGSNTTTTDKQSVYNAPENAIYVSVFVKPISKTYKVNDVDTYYWTAEWSTKRTYHFSDNPPEKPSTPTVTIEKTKLRAELNNIDTSGVATHIEFQVVRDNLTVFKTGKARITTSYVSWECDVITGSEYKVRCRAYSMNNGGQYSDWTDYTDNMVTIPKRPTLVICRANSETSVYLEWTYNPSSPGETWDLEYATKEEYFDKSDETTTVTGITTIQYEKTGLETGTEYFFRVRAVNEAGESDWSLIKSVTIGKEPAAPTTWSSTTTAVTGESVILYWVHNSEDGSSWRYAERQVYINGQLDDNLSATMQNNAPDDEKDKTSSYTINTSSYTEGTKIEWRVRTAGVTGEYGDWSVMRTIDVYGVPVLELILTDVNDDPLETLTSFPFKVSGFAGPNTQSPIGYHLSITSNSIYETVDQIGNSKMVNVGEQLYSKYFNISDPLSATLSASDVDLENNIEYTITCTVTMNSGLTATETITFSVSWEDVGYMPNAEISIDTDTLAAYIKPYCEQSQSITYKVNYANGQYIKTATVVDGVYEEPMESPATTTTGEEVHYGTNVDGETIYFCVVEESELVPNISLSVYRREFDGSFTEIITGVDNLKNTFVTDPHPALDYARYRIVAISNSTGSVGYYDPPGYPVGEKAAVIQWDEDWSQFETSEENELEQPPWSGSLLKLPYNLDVSDSHSADITLVEYIGRKHPVSYYGTQLGEKSSWKMEIDKKDSETLYSLRRLAAWMGDVYVREPSGSGYWASISISFSQTHCKLTIPITLDISRVEGGI